MDSSEGKQKDKETLIEMVKLCYKLQGKGKNRKRELSEVLEIIENKTRYFEKLESESFCLNQVYNAEENKQKKTIITVKFKIPQRLQKEQLIKY